MIHLSRLRSLRSKKRLVSILSATVFLLAIAGYIFWSKQAWAQLTPASTQWHQGVKADVDQVVTLPAANEAERDALTRRLLGISQKIDRDEDTICSVNRMAQWQRQVVPSLKDTQRACEDRLGRTTELRKEIDDVLAYVKDEQALAKLISTAPQAGELADGSWEKQMVGWESTAKAAEKMTVSDSFRPTQQVAVKRLASVKVAWQEVIAAHQAKDKQKYLAAQNALASAIDSLNEVATVSQQTFTRLAGELEAAALKALGQ